MKECLIDSKFYQESSNQFNSFLSTPFIFLESKGDNYLTNESGEFPSICPSVFFNLYPYDATFIADATGLIDTENHPLIIGNRVRYKSGGVWRIEQLSANQYDEQIDFSLSNETYVQIESNLLYNGIVFDDSQPSSDNGGFIYWWDTDTETLYFLRDSITPIEIEPLSKISKTQEEINEDSTEVYLISPLGSVLKKYNPHNITKIDITDNKPIDRAGYSYFWEEVDSKLTFGAVPRKQRQLNEPEILPDVNLLEPCTEFQFNNQDIFQRFSYEQKSNQYCKDNFGINPCYEKKTFKCQESP